MKTNSPWSTYRIQFHKGFNFDEFERVIPYLEKLGVQTIYASPIFKSVPGSNHGYDGLDPLQVNPEIGTLQQLRKLKKRLSQSGIGWLQDIVPNHMAFHPGNEWLMDVLQHGEESIFASFFDIDWSQGKLMVPVLGASLEEVIEKNELGLARKDGNFVLKYFENEYPLNQAGEESIVQFLNQGGEIEKDLKAAGGEVTKFDSGEIIFDKAVINEVVGKQFYRLCHWKETDTRINYRRFFTVNGLICLNMQDEKVFRKYHQLIKKLVEDGTFQGLRIDHIDGLYDPAKYLTWLDELTGRRAYIVVEKILQASENLPRDWKTEGTTGYDFLSLVNNLFTNKKAETEFREFYRELTGSGNSPGKELYEKKAHILYRHMGGELENLVTAFMDIIRTFPPSGLSKEDLKKAIGEFLVHCPVYRFYGDRFPLDDAVAEQLRLVFSAIRVEGSENAQAIGLLEKTLLDPGPHADPQTASKLLHFYRRCMQFTGPLMAKGLEDTLMYTHNYFIGHNDVGDSPANFGISISEFHQAMIDRQQNWPFTLNTTSTHDTKRGEDVRARLNVLTDIPDQWFHTVRQWMETTRESKRANLPTASEEYFIYQGLFGAYPMSGDDAGDFQARFLEYIKKALREAKTNSDWADPDQEYENAVTRFVADLLASSSSFWKIFEPFHKGLVNFGIINSLCQLLLKFTCPGIPDVYQGCEQWDLSFVDPDNRRQVNFEQRSAVLAGLERAANREDILKNAGQSWENGQIKPWLTRELFKLRKNSGNFFERADYTPLEVSGQYADHVLAFGRQWRKSWLIVVLPLHLAELCKDQQAADFLSIDWKDTCLEFPAGAGKDLTEIFSDRKIKPGNNLSIQSLFQPLPFSLLRLEEAESFRFELINPPRNTISETPLK